MATINYDDQKSPIKWDGSLDHPLSPQNGIVNSSIPSKVDSPWDGYVNGHEGLDGYTYADGVRDWDNTLGLNGHTGPWGGDSSTGAFPLCFSYDDWETRCVREDYDINQTGAPEVSDILNLVFAKFARPDIINDDMINRLTDLALHPGTVSHVPGGPSTYTWNDVSFLLEIMDGIGTGGRRARQERLNKFDEVKKDKLIHLICRVKGVKVYDERKTIGDVQIKLEDVDLIAERILGRKMKVEGVNVL